MEKYNILEEVERQEVERQEVERQEVENRDENYWNKIEKFIEDNRNTFFWIILVAGIILIINQNSNQSKFQFGGETPPAPGPSPGPEASAGLEVDKNKKGKVSKAMSSTKGKSYSATTTDEGAYGAANYAMSFKYQISALIQMVAITVFLLIVVLPPLSILIIGALSFIMLKPNLKSLFRL